jgi:hypothetical protein
MAYLTYNGQFLRTPDTSLYLDAIGVASMPLYYWPLDNSLNEIVQGNNLKNYNLPPEFTHDAPNGTSYSFVERSSNYINEYWYTDVSSLSNGIISKSFSVSWWYKNSNTPTANSNGLIEFGSTVPALSQFLFYEDAGKYKIRSWSPFGSPWTYILPNSIIWNHIVFVGYTSSNLIKIYINSILVNTTSTDVGILNGQAIIGNFQYLSTVRLANIRLYNRALLDTEIVNIYNSKS